MDKIDFYHVWCIRSVGQYELAMKKGGQYEGLMRCREEGLIGNIVISTHLPGPQIENTIERLKEIDGWEKKLNRRLARFLRFAKKVKRKLKSICRFD